jgi:hypothetical protein
MNDQVKEILIDLIDYYNVIGTEDDPGFVPFADIVGRASNALRHAAREHKAPHDNHSGGIDPFTMDVIGPGTQLKLPLKHENEY